MKWSHLSKANSAPCLRTTARLNLMIHLLWDLDCLPDKIPSRAVPEHVLFSFLFIGRAKMANGVVSQIHLFQLLVCQNNSRQNSFENPNRIVGQRATRQGNKGLLWMWNKLLYCRRQTSSKQGNSSKGVDAMFCVNSFKVFPNNLLVTTPAKFFTQTVYKPATGASPKAQHAAFSGCEGVKGGPSELGWILHMRPQSFSSGC